MSNNGWISLHRKITNHWIWKTDKPFDKRAAWIDILLMVNHKPGKVFFNNEILKVDVGERITSEVKLAERWGWSRTKVRTFLNLLEQDNMLKVLKKDKKRTRLKVLNYSKYQHSKNNRKTTEKQEENNKKTRAKQEQNINNNDNNENNELINNKCSDSNESNAPKFNQESMPFKAAKYLRKLVLENNPRQPVPDPNPKDLENWALELDRLNRLGPVGAKNKGYNWKEIGEIMEWCQDHHFWKSNILSASKFREKIVQLENQMKSSPSSNKSSTNTVRNLYQKYKEEETR